MTEPPGIEKYMWQLLAAIAALASAVVFMFKTILAGKDQHLKSVVEQHSLQIREHREAMDELKINLAKCEEKHAQGEKEARELWWTIARKFGTTPEKLQKEANDDSGKVL